MNDGTFDPILERLKTRLNAEGLLDLDTWFVDSTNASGLPGPRRERKRGL
jgi:hypothetical protein